MATEMSWGKKIGPGLVFFLCGCDPIVSIQGAFFPAWLFCLLAGVAGTVLLRFVFAQRGLEEHMGPLPLLYTSLATLLSVALWLIFYRT